MKYPFVFGIAFWWMTLPTLYAQTNDLNYYINHALENSPLCKEYGNQLIINRLDSLILKADYQPSLHFSTNNFWAPMVNDYGYDEAITHKGRNNALLTVRQTIIGQGNFKTRLDAYTLDNQSLQNAKSIEEQELKLAVAAQYITAYGILQEFLFNQEFIFLLETEATILKKLTEGAFYKQTDYLSFHIALKQQQLLADQQKAEYLNNLALLNYLCGLADTSFVRLEKPDILLRPPYSFENTLQFYRFQIDSLKIQNRSALIDYAYRPKFDIYADAGFNTTFAHYTYKHFGASIGFSLSIPIFDGGQRQKQHNKLNISEQIRRDYQDFSRQQYRQQLDRLYQQLEQTEKIINHAQSIIDATQTLMQAYGIQLQTGDAAIADYMLSINHYLNAQHIVTRHSINKIQIINQINYWNHEK